MLYYACGGLIWVGKWLALMIRLVWCCAKSFWDSKYGQNGLDEIVDRCDNGSGSSSLLIAIQCGKDLPRKRVRMCAPVECIV
eukprot:scaffold5771_cov171-Amphora_coffeaeformis.AAC.24